MKNEIIEYMKETSRKSDDCTLSLVDSLKEEGKEIHTYTNHLPHLRNRLVNGNMAIPKSRNALGRLVFESFSEEDWTTISPILSFIELSTVATYVLDDIIDHQPTRQGEEATWKKYGVNQGIIAGGLQTFLAYQALDKLKTSDKNLLRIQQLANRMWLRLWIGEGFNEEMREGTTIEEYTKRSYDICGVMFGTIAQSVAVHAGASEPQIQLASEIGINYGLATMIRNDLVDLLPKVQKHSKALTKEPYEDVNKGIWTYPIIYAAQHGKDEERRIIRETLGNSCSPEQYAQFQRVLSETGAIKATLDLITSYKEKTNQKIKELPEKPSKKLLFELTEALENLRGYAKN